MAVMDMANSLPMWLACGLAVALVLLLGMGGVVYGLLRAAERSRRKKETHGIEPCVSEIRIVIRDYYHQLEWSTDPAIPDAECSPPLMVHLIV